MLRVLPDGWRETRLEDVCERVTVGHVGPMAKEYVESGVSFLRSQNVQPFRIKTEDIRFIRDEFDKKLKKSALKPGDVVVVRTGYPGTAAVIPPNIPSANCADLVVITPSPQLDPWFLTCIFNSVWGKDTVAGNLVGVAQQHFNVGAAKAMKIALPPLPTQQRIASILSAYDDLIENNTRRIAILEEMARRLYEEWFVHFRFPGYGEAEFVETELGRTPQSWRVQVVAQTFEITGGGTPSKRVEEYWNDGTIEWFSPTDLTRAATMFMDGSSSKITPLGLRKSSARLFPPFSVMMTSRATIGAIAINTTEACTNQGFITCIPNDRFPLHLLLHWLRDNVEMFISLASGATFKEISKGVFKEIKLLVPSQHVVDRFERTVGPSMQEALVLQRKNANLRAQRDLLLPKLVSGEIDVSGAEEAMEAAE